MRNNLQLNLLYHYTSLREEQREVSYYKIVSFFSDAGAVSASIIDKVKAAYPYLGTDEWIGFESLDDLGRFAVNICQETSSPEVFILSTSDYNLGLESVNDIRAFREIFRRYGTSLSNPDIEDRKRNLFSKFFQ